MCSKNGSGSEECNAVTEGREYDLKKITVPIDLYYADNDWLASPSVCMKGSESCFFLSNHRIRLKTAMIYEYVTACAFNCSDYNVE
jgi:hypothetical protein